MSNGANFAEQCRQLTLDGNPPDDIATLTYRTVRYVMKVQNRLVDEGRMSAKHLADARAATTKSVGEKRCLKCRQAFRPAHSGLFVCGSCKKSCDWHSGGSYSCGEALR